MLAVHPFRGNDGKNYRNRNSSNSNVIVNGIPVSTQDKKENKETELQALENGMPVICVQSYGKGRSMAFMSDSAGGWGIDYQMQWGPQPNTNDYYEQFWTNTIRWLAENSMAKHRLKLIGNTDAISYKPGGTVKLRAQILAPTDPEEMAVNKVVARLLTKDSSNVDLAFDADRNEFIGELKLPDVIEGDEVGIEFRAIDPESQLIGKDVAKIRLLKFSKEYNDPTPDTTLMADLARVTEGKVLENTDDLLALLNRKVEDEKDKRQYNVPLWDSTWMWALIVFLFSVEWLLRRLVRY